MATARGFSSPNFFIFLYKENFLELNELFKVKSYEEFYFNPRFELDKINIIQIAKKFSRNIKLLPPRKGERYASALTNMSLSNRIYRVFGKVKISDYIRELKEKHNK